MMGRDFFSRIFGAGADEDETTRLPAEEIEKLGRNEPERERQSVEFPVERAAGIIDDLPPDVPQESALRIVRGTLTAAGVEIEGIKRSIRTRESKLDSDIQLARGRQEDLRERTEEVVRSLEEEIRKARKDRDAALVEEEEKVSRAVRGLEEVRRVRDFFGFPETEGDETADPAEDDETTQSFDSDETRVIRRPSSLEEANEPAEGPSRYDTPGTTDER